MKDKSSVLYTLTAVSFGGLIGFHLLAMYFDLYWIFRWLDIPMHFWGGLAVGFFAVWYFLDHFKHSVPANKLMFIVLMLGFVSLVGILWEFYEFGCDAIFFANSCEPVLQGTSKDTMGDLLMDLLGGLTAIITSLIILKTKKLDNGK